MGEKRDLRDVPLAGLEPLMAELGEPKFRAKQLADWLYPKNAPSIEAMTNLSKPLRVRLSLTHTAEGLTTLARLVSGDGAVKYLFGLKDGLSVETVYIPEEKRKTVCVSTQVGCKFGCVFCATGAMGFKRNLSAGEILNQVAMVRRDAGEITNIVFMGMGEPLDNLDAVAQSAAVMKACAEYPLQKGRTITMEVILFDGVNDRPQDAQKLIKALHGVKAKVNIIRFNPVEGVALRPSSKAAVDAFQSALLKADFETTIRNSRGSDINAACGQLKSSFVKYPSD